MNKKTFIATIIMTAVLVSLVSGVVVAKSETRTITVPDDYPSIQAAIDKAIDGDTIYVKKGTYVENPVVNKSISLVGEDRDATVIDVTAGLKVERDYVTVTGFAIYDGWQGITISANYSKILGNKITNAQYGIVLLSSQNSTIEENMLLSIGLSAAIQLSYSNNNLLKNNYIDSCTEGIQLREGSSNNMVTENIITTCQGVAVRLLGSGIGKKWYGPDGNTITENNISDSGCGTTIYGANGNVISNNNYVNNTIQFSANEDYYLTFGYSRSVNTINENYWSDYSGKDFNGDGIGDTPYIIDAYNKDNYPLMSPINLDSSPNPTSSPTPILSPSISPSPSPIPSAIQQPTLEPSLSVSPPLIVDHFPNYPLMLQLIIIATVVVSVAGLLIYFKKRGAKRE